MLVIVCVNGGKGEEKKALLILWRLEEQKSRPFVQRVAEVLVKKVIIATDMRENFILVVLVVHVLRFRWR